MQAFLHSPDKTSLISRNLFKQRQVLHAIKADNEGPFAVVRPLRVLHNSNKTLLRVNPGRFSYHRLRWEIW